MISLLSLLVLSAQASFDRVQHEGNTIAFDLRTSGNAIYVLDEASSIASGWTEKLLVDGTGAGVRLTNETSGAARFFRAREFPRVLVSKPGASLAAGFALSNSPVGQWAIEGELPEGITFAQGVFSGMPAVSAPEKYNSGNFTNRVRLIAGARESSAEIVHHVRLSYSRNIFAERANGPSFGAICIKCHGSGFPPDFSPTATTLINVKAGSGGECPTTWSYIVPGDLDDSLIYRKVVAPPCGDRMPQGGPFFNATQIDRLARWISELPPGETD